MKKILMVTIVISLTLLLVSFFNAFGSTSFKIEKNMEELMDEITQNMAENPEKAYSSNPYDYIDNQYFRNIVNLGPKALFHIRNKIKKSERSGLKEYILAIAAEKIAKVDLRGETYNWTNGKEWVREWERHLRNIPDDIERIDSFPKPMDVKIKALIKLGVPAIPYIMDKVEEGKAEYVPALEVLLEGNQDVSFTKEAIKDYSKWIKKNKAKFENFRVLIEDLIEEAKY
jgi:hypothetical protein